MQPIVEAGGEKLLDLIDIGTPCPVDWKSMKGDQAKRFCSQCQLHVYDLSQMSTKQAEEFLQQSVGQGKRACARIYRRADGTVMTRDCHTIRLRLRRALNFWQQAAAVACSFVLSAAASYAGGDQEVELNSQPQSRRSLPLLQSIVSPEFRAAASAIDQGQFARALTLLNELEPAVPVKVEELRYLRALCLQVLGRFEGSRDEYDWVVKNGTDAILRAKAKVGELQVGRRRTAVLLSQITGPLTTVMQPGSMIMGDVCLPATGALPGTSSSPGK